MARRRIATRYAALVAAALVATLVIGGAVEAWVSHRERLAALETLQRDKARTAAAAVARFADDILRNLSWVALTPLSGEARDLEQRRLDFVKLLRLEPAITTAILLDAEGRERLRVSRIQTDRIDSGEDRSALPGYRAARAGRTHFAEVEFVAQSEPYLTVAVPSAARDGSVVLADVNLKFVRNVVSEIRVGETGYAYVVDPRGRLVSHPDLSLVLQMSELGALGHVRQALADVQSPGFVDEGRNLLNEPVLAAYARVAPLDWTVFVEQPRREAMVPLTASVLRSASILLIALAVAVPAGIAFARRMVAPLGELREGARRFGEGDLEHRIDVSTGDELQDLAAQFNAMAAHLRMSYADLERRVRERTRDLNERNRQVSEALEQKTATAEILRAISSSPTDARPVFETIVSNAARLCSADTAFVMLLRGGALRLAARTDCTVAFAAYLADGIRLDGATTTGRAALSGRPVQILDFMNEPGVVPTPAHRVEQVRTVLAVPLMREDRLLGVISIWRREVRAFSGEQVRLLETFAAQAVIAIENLRLFEQIQETSHQLGLANQAKSRLLAAASHDLRQPLHALSLFVDQLKSSRSPEERAVLTQRVAEAVQTLTDLLDQLLDLSRLEAGQVSPSAEDFALAGLLERLGAQFRPIAAAKGVRLRVRAADVWVKSDPVLVQRMLLNLLTNAVRYTERGDILLGCRRRGDGVQVGVWDTGPGIPAERHQEVFREFVRLVPGDRGRSGGLGLGLAIVARVAELLGTRIELRSQVGRGSLFAFELPRGTPAPLPLAAAPDAIDGAFVMVVDDDAAARDAMCGLLERWGCITLAAASAGDGFAALRGHERSPELIVCDYRLADDENGLDAVARLRAVMGSATPALLVTADTDAEVVRQAQARGIPVLRKPLSPVKLRAVVSRLLSHAPMTGAA